MFAFFFLFFQKPTLPSAPSHHKTIKWGCGCWQLFSFWCGQLKMNIRSITLNLRCLGDWGCDERTGQFLLHLLGACLSFFGGLWSGGEGAHSWAHLGMLTWKHNACNPCHLGWKGHKDHLFGSRSSTSIPCHGLGNLPLDQVAESEVKVKQRLPGFA